MALPVWKLQMNIAQDKIVENFRSLIKQDNLDDLQEFEREWLAGYDNQKKLAILDSIGRECAQDGHIKAGIQIYERIVVLLSSEQKADGRSRQLLGALLNLGRFYTLDREYTKAERKLGIAAQLALSQFGEQSSQFAECLFLQSEPAYREKNYSQAGQLLSKAASIWEKAERPPVKLGACYNNLGRIYEEMGILDEGIYWHKRAVELRRTLPIRDDLAFSLGNLGIALAMAGKLTAAIHALEESLDTYAQTGHDKSQDAVAFRMNLETLKRFESDPE